MFSSESYELLHFHDGRKVERFGQQIVDRPCPAATHQNDDWFEDDSEAQDENDFQFSNSAETLRFSGKIGDGKWSRRCSDDNWMTRFRFGPNVFPDRNETCNQEGERQICFHLHTSDSGQIGLFPEQAVNWEWIAKKCFARQQRELPRAKILNLFAYTGGSTMAAAAGGAEVTHVDSAKSVVNWARRNAETSGLSDCPIRWIVEDVPKFVAREVKRGNRYDGIILDPPSYGHGPKREEWKLARDLMDLLANCKQLLSPQPALFLLSCHTPGFGAPELNAALSTCLFGSCSAGVQTRELFLSTGDGRRLQAGHAAFWP